MDVFVVFRRSEAFLELTHVQSCGFSCALAEEAGAFVAAMPRKHRRFSEEVESICREDSPYSR